MIPFIFLAAIASEPVTEAVSRHLAGQAEAWNRGDLEAALGAYCPTPEIIWVNRSGVSRGFEEFAASMRADFRSPAAMGRMAAEVLDTRAVSPDSALVTIRWSITRDGTRLMGGVSTQLWAPCQGRLRIVFEHAS